MSVGSVPQPAKPSPRSGFYRLSVAQFRRMIQTGILSEDDRIELLEGHLVPKMPPNPPHSSTFGRVTRQFLRILPDNWQYRSEQPITLSDSEPQPDTCVARGNVGAYDHRHPTPADIGLVGEVADSSLDDDRGWKGRIYASAKLPVYWIFNLVDRQIEVYTDPRPADLIPACATRTDYRTGDAVPLILDGQTVALIPVADLLG